MAWPGPVVRSGMGYYRYKEAFQHSVSMFFVPLPTKIQEQATDLRLLASPMLLRKHSLLEQSTDLYGRDQELAMASALLRRPDVRLLVMTGPAGVGKTRLALQVATSMEESFPHGICRVSLASIREATLVLPTIAQELGFSGLGERDSHAQVEMYFREKSMLLLLDNFEQVAEGAPLLAGLLSHFPDLKILATSRETLRLRAEHEFVVSPLALPERQQAADPEQLKLFPAVALFLQRARAARSDFQLTSANAPVVAEICARLDGLPLALELAAARIKLLSPQALLERLEHRLQVLTSGARDLPRRQQTLRNALSWSYDLLDREEQAIFRLLSVFAHGCSLEIAEEVCCSVYGTEINVLKVIASLIDKNLLQREEQNDGEARLRMLETIREYGQECLAHLEESEKAFKAHAMHYLTLAEIAETEMKRGPQGRWLIYLEQEYENLLAALHWFIRQEKMESALALCSALGRFWTLTEHQSEGYEWIKRALAGSERATVSPGTRARALSTAGILANHQGQYQRGIEFLHRSLAFYQEVEDHQGIAAVLNTLGHAYARITPGDSQHFYQQESPGAPPDLFQPDQSEVSPPTSVQSDGLTPREVEVLRLVARGLTNGQIAEKLVISANTVHAHLSSIYSKTSLSSRSAATRYAIEHKLS